MAPVMQKVCDTLVQERERQIRSQALHRTQEQTELSCYDNSVERITPMLKKSTFYQQAPPYQRLLDDVARYLGQ